MQSLDSAAARTHTGDCVAIAPEGTRSTTGHVLPFKKGPFHLFEDLKTAAIIPVVIMGAFDLYPPGRMINIPGKVYVKYLTPISPSEAPDKEKMSRLVRRRILTALLDTPADTGKELGWFLRLLNLQLVLLFIFLARRVLLFIAASSGLSTPVFAVAFIGGHMVMSVLLYLYF